LLRSTLALSSLIVLGLTASAHAQAVSAPPAAPAPITSAPDSGRNVDPWEKTNRGLFLVGGALDVVVIRPVSIFYKHAAPRPAREGVHNVVVNLGEPVNFVNRVLQLRPGAAANTLGRFAVNSTVGLAGIFDVASGAGLPEQGTNFGQTMSRYGVGQGPYLFLPIFGPSSVRDATGRVVDTVLDPLNWLSFRDDTYFFASRAVAGGVDARVQADPALRYIQQTATDSYAALRSAYLQNANFMAGGGKVDVKSLPDFGPEPASGPNAAPKPN
jgi:phospholipid-binding lipoprotein MlaA